MVVAVYRSPGLAITARAFVIDGTFVAEVTGTVVGAVDTITVSGITTVIGANISILAIFRGSRLAKSSGTLIRFRALIPVLARGPVFGIRFGAKTTDAVNGQTYIR